MKYESKCARGGGARASKKLLAAMAVLAVAFVVLAAVPVALTDSNATKAEASGATETLAGTAGTYFVGSGTGSQALSGSVTVILEKGKTYTFTGQQTATFYIGEKENSKYYYESTSKIIITGNSAATTVTASNDGTSYDVTFGTSAVLTSGIGVFSSATKATVYSLNSVPTSRIVLDAENEMVQVVGSDSTAGATATYTLNIDSKASSTGSVVNSVQMVLNLASAQTGKVSWGTNGSLTLAGLSTGDGTWVGTITPTQGKLTLTDGSDTSKMRGVYKADDKALYSVGADIEIDVENSDTAKILKNTEVSKDVAIKAKAAEDSSITFWTMLDGFRVGADGDLTITFAVSTNITGADLAASATTSQNWTGTLQADSYLSAIASVALGDLKVIAEPNDSSYFEIGAVTVLPGSDVSISGTKTAKVVGNITVSDVSGSGATEKVAKLTIASGADVLVANDISIDVGTKAVLTIKGTLAAVTLGQEIVDGIGDSTYGTVNVLAGATITGIGFDEALTVNIDESVMNEKKESGEVSTGTTTYPQNQIVVIDGSWTLVPGAVVYVYGKLSVPEGATITVQEGAQLILQREAVAEIEGTIIVDEKSANSRNVDGIFDVQKGTAKISGSAVIGGNLKVGATGTVEVCQDAILTVSENGELYFTSGAASGFKQIVVDQGGSFVFNGLNTSAAMTIYNHGTIVIDSSEPATLAMDIKQMVSGATVDVVKFTVEGALTSTAKITISDVDLQFAYSKGTYVVNTNEKNELLIAANEPADNTTKADVFVTGIEVVSGTSSVSKESTESNVASNGIYNDKKWTKTMTISGSVDSGFVAKENQTPTLTGAMGATVTLTGLYGTDKTRAYAVVSDAFSIAEKSTFNLGTTARLVVTGTVSTATTGASFTNTSGSIAVQDDGEIASFSSSILTSIEAVYYVTSATSQSGSVVKTYHYVAIDKALAYVTIDSDVDKIVVLGNQTVSADASLPAGVTLDINSGATVTIGAQAGATTELVIASGATVKGTGIVVNGTLYAEDKSNIKSPSSIISDVYSEEIGEDGKAVKNGWAEWTNVADAIASGSGKTITVSKTDDYVVIAQSLTIPEGTTLVVPADAKGLKLASGVTLTIDGVLKTDAEIYAAAAFDVAPKNVSGSAYASTVVVNGELYSVPALAFGNGTIATSEPTTPVKLSAGAPISGAYYTVDISSQTYYVISPLETAFENVEDVKSPITVNGAVSAGDLTYNGTSDSKVLLVGTASVKDGSGNAISTSLKMTSLTLVGASFGASAGNGVFSGSIVVGDASVTATGVEDLYVSISSGKMVLGGTTDASDKDDKLEITAGTVYMASSYAANVYKQNLIVASGATLTTESSTGTISAMTVNGTLSVPAGKSVTVTTLVVSGSVSVESATSTTSAGTLTVGTAYIGVSPSTTITFPATSAGASVAGPVDIKSVALVSSSASVEQDMSGFYSTEFYNGGSLWFTAYAKDSGKKIDVSYAPVENVKFLGWATKQDATTGATTVTIGGTSGSSKVYSIVKEEIYTIVIKADQGIGDLYLNGNIMQKGQITVAATDSTPAYAYYAYWATVKAGTYEVTCKLANGYSGTAVLKDETGATLAGNKLTTPTADDYTTVNFQLTGIEKSGYVQPTEEKDNSGLTVTDYLLIVLVILVVILAVIVALRLMRS